MLLTALRVVYLLACAGAAAAYVAGVEVGPRLVREHPFVSWLLIVAVLGSVILLDLLIRKKEIQPISAVYFGVLVGSLLSFILMQAVRPYLEGTGTQQLVEVMLTLGLCYISVSFLLQTRDDFRFIIPFVEFDRELKGGRPMIPDASTLIDGRLADVVETGLVDTLIIIPDYVIDAVRETASTGDRNRKARGKRGLEVLERLRNMPGTQVRVDDSEGSQHDGEGAEYRILYTAKRHDGRIVTADRNLTKAAAVQGLDCINLNDVSAALKPQFLPGDQLSVRIQREGEAAGQGVAYLEDGTMVVCEEAVSHKGQEIEVVVTRVHQTNNGRIIFSRLAA